MRKLARDMATQQDIIDEINRYYGSRSLSRGNRAKIHKAHNEGMAALRKFIALQRKKGEGLPQSTSQNIPQSVPEFLDKGQEYVTFEVTIQSVSLGKQDREDADAGLFWSEPDPGLIVYSDFERKGYVGPVEDRSRITKPGGKGSFRVKWGRGRTIHVDLWDWDDAKLNFSERKWAKRNRDKREENQVFVSEGYGYAKYAKQDNLIDGHDYLGGLRFTCDPLPQDTVLPPCPLEGSLPVGQDSFVSFTSRRITE